MSDITYLKEYFDSWRECWYAIQAPFQTFPFHSYLIGTAGTGLEWRAKFLIFF
jgi:hypothetical protein